MQCKPTTENLIDGGGFDVCVSKLTVSVKHQVCHDAVVRQSLTHLSEQNTQRYDQPCLFTGREKTVNLCNANAMELRK